ncbi:hypothetical protein BH10BAC5_BH10BAC5_03410 [soil metagenome]
MKFILIAITGLIILSASVTKAQSVEELYNKGNYNINKGKFEDAILNFNDALLQDSAYYKAYHGRGTAELSLGMFKEAIKDYTQAIKFKFNFAEAFYARGLAKLSVGDMDGACLDFHHAKDFNLKEALEMMDRYCR